MIPDSEFIKTPEVPGPTKEEVRCIVMCKSKVLKGDIVADIGCGTGGLTAEFAKKAKEVYSIDKNPDALEVTEKNLKKHGLLIKANLFEGDALEVMDEIPDFNVLMVGGSNGKLSSIIKKGYNKLKNGGRIIVTSILLETRVEAVKTLQSLDMIPDVVEVSISKGKITKSGTMMIANNPITIISATKVLED